MAVQGVVSRTVRDSARLFDAIIGPEPTGDYDGELPPVPFAELIKSAAGQAEDRLLREVGDQQAPDPEAVKALETTAQLLTELGHEVEEIDPPYDDKALAATS